MAKFPEISPEISHFLTNTAVMQMSRLLTNLYTFGKKGSPHILHKKNYCDLNFGESLCILTFFLFSDSGLNPAIERF